MFVVTIGSFYVIRTSLAINVAGNLIVEEAACSTGLSTNLRFVVLLKGGDTKKLESLIFYDSEWRCADYERTYFHNEENWIL